MTFKFFLETVNIYHNLATVRYMTLGKKELSSLHLHITETL